VRILALVLLALAGPAFADQQEQGKRVFDHICVYCHGPGVWGTNRLAKRYDKDHALLESHTDLSADAIRAIVRKGVGSMPPMRRTEVSDADLDAVAAYLTRKSR
jgi:mono/diheme cytochrome c family protein